MQLIKSRIKSAKKRAKQQVKSLAEDAQQLYGNVKDPGGCMKEASKQAKGIRERKKQIQDQLNDAESQILKLARKRWNKIKEQAEDATENLDEQTRQLIEEAKSRAIREAEEASETYVKAAQAAINLVANNLDVVFQGIIFILLKRTENNLENITEALRTAYEQVNDIQAAADIFSESEGILPNGGFADLPDASAALDDLEDAIRDLRLVRQIYAEELVIEPIPTRDAKRNLEEASRVLESNKAIRSARKILDQSSVDTGISIENDGPGIRLEVSGSLQDAEIEGKARYEIERRIRTLENAKDAIKNLPGTLTKIAIEYQMLRTWGDLARLLPENIDSMDAAARLINTDQKLQEVQEKTYEVFQDTKGLDGAGVEEVKKRAELSAKTREAVTELEKILAVSSVSAERGEQIYNAAMDMYSRPFFTGDAFVNDIEDIEINALLMDEAQDVASSIGFAIDAATQLQETLGEVRDVKRQASYLVQESEGRPALFNSILDLLNQAGISKPVEVIIRGQLPSQIKQIITAGGVATDALAAAAEADCSDVNIQKIMPGDREYFYASAVDRARQNKIRLSGATQAMSESKRLSKVQQFGLKSADLI